MEKKKKSFLIKFGDFIVDFRYLFACVFGILAVICALNIHNVTINYDITSYLADETETKQGLRLMESEFGSLNELQVMLTDISYEDALVIKSELSAIPHVTGISFDESENYYKDRNALFVILLDDVTNDESTEVVNLVKEKIQNQEYYLYVENGEDVVEGMDTILLIAICIIVIVLFLTTTSYFEIVLAFIVFGISILLNMGSNFLFGEISYITESIAMILQLGLSLDYFIIFMNHYMKEKNDTTDLILAVKKTVSKSLPEIFASSLTTIAGLLALVFMQLKIGADIGIILSKGILCSLLTVIFFLPFLLVVFHKAIDKTEHKVKIPNISKLANFIVSKHKILLAVFVILLVCSIFVLPKYDYVYNIYSVKAYNEGDNQIALEKIEDTFGSTNRLVVLFKQEEKDYNKELMLTQELLNNEKIASVTSLGGFKIDDEIYLGTKLSYQNFSQLFQIPMNESLKLYGYYLQVNDLQEDVTTYQISLVDLIYFLYENLEELQINDALKETILNYYTMLNNSISLLESPEYSRFILELKTPSEGEETYALLEDVRNSFSSYYDDVKLVGESVSAKDLSESFKEDNLIITLVTILFIAIIIFCTFKSLPVTILLIFMIEGSIFINFGLHTLFGNQIFFISYIIVSAIQMGATIDYAIVLTNRYLQLRAKIDHEKALVNTIKECLPTIVTSGFILTIAGFLIGFISSSGVVSSIGIFLGCGTLISMLITLFVLPAVLYIADSILTKEKRK